DGQPPRYMAHQRIGNINQPIANFTAGYYVRGENEHRNGKQRKNIDALNSSLRQRDQGQAQVGGTESDDGRQQQRQKNRHGKQKQHARANEQDNDIGHLVHLG